MLQILDKVKTEKGFGVLTLTVECKHYVTIIPIYTSVYKESPHILNNHCLTPLTATKYSGHYLGELAGALHLYVMFAVIL